MMDMVNPSLTKSLRHKPRKMKGTGEMLPPPTVEATMKESWKNVPLAGCGPKKKKAVEEDGNGVPNFREWKKRSRRRPRDVTNVFTAAEERAAAESVPELQAPKVKEMDDKLVQSMEQRSKVEIGGMTPNMPGEATPAQPPPGEMTPAWPPGEMTPALPPGEETPAMAPGDMTPAAGDMTPAMPPPTHGDITPAMPPPLHGDITPAMPGEMTPAMPGEMTPAMPGEMTPAMPGEMTPAMPGEMTPAMPGEMTPAMPAGDMTPAMGETTPRPGDMTPAMPPIMAGDETPYGVPYTPADMEEVVRSKGEATPVQQVGDQTPMGVPTMPHLDTERSGAKAPGSKTSLQKEDLDASNEQVLPGMETHVANPPGEETPGAPAEAPPLPGTMTPAVAQSPLEVKRQEEAA